MSTQQALPPWEAASNGAGARPWFIQREGADKGNWPGGIALWYLWRADGSLTRFASADRAHRIAARLNRQEAAK